MVLKFSGFFFRVFCFVLHSSGLLFLSTVFFGIIFIFSPFKNMYRLSSNFFPQK